ncbi:DUF3182 family protein [Azorhizophilus paspali]|uniref:DUF3182 family protein n=1 Tax=Azorhizophilus paspali TaxID=69963 RepID=A0ABV6SMR7_AZOPA
MKTAAQQEGRNGPGTVVIYSNRDREALHERAVHFHLGHRLARLQGLDFGGEYDPDTRYPGGLYFVPTGTVIGRRNASRLGMRSAADLFGGVVPRPFMATKAITHGLLHSGAQAPPGWSPGFVRRVADAVLRGFTAFNRKEAGEAGRRLLAEGPLRIKPVLATGGRGQRLVADPAELERQLAALDETELSHFGLVLEEHLEQVSTYSVGQAQVGDLLATYCGTQRLTCDNRGEEVYGGSDLLVVAGDFAELLALELDDPLRLAVQQARIYDAAALRSFAGFFASRRNYDIARGLDSRGHTRCGVLEQSWRIGGASSAEIAALEAFRAGARSVRTSSLELFGADKVAPAGASILFRGEDPELGYLTKCVVTTDNGNP